MHPTLFDADLLEIEQASRISVGDVILFVSVKIWLFTG